MSISIRWLDISFSTEKMTLPDKDFYLMEKSFAILERKTGVKIDQYSDIKLSPDHAQILLDNTCKEIFESTVSLKKLYSFLVDSFKKSYWLYLEGD